jgi:uncharacterized SAM-binding protein YcdF (DUF218 family)
MESIGLPERPITTRWRRLGNRAVGLFDGVRWVVGVALLVDAFRSFFTPDASLLGILVRWPGGVALPAPCGLVLGLALLVRRRRALFVLAPAAFLAALNIVEFYRLKADGLDAAAWPFSAVTLALFAGAVFRLFREGPTANPRCGVAGAVVAAPALVALHLLSFGATDYSRRAEAIVVFGAGVYPDGSPSLALEDRVKHGVRLWRQGFSPVLVMSGGADEVPVMERLAVEAGVSAEAIERDPEGVNTYATLRNLRHARVVAVSHYYHLARIKLAAGRLGIRCATVPCAMTRRLQREPWFVARELAAYAGYYLLK